MADSKKQSFSAQVDTIIVNTEKRLELVMKQSLLNAINEMQKPVAKGGKMRVDTGFLRASGQSSLTGMPSGPSRKPDNAEKGQFDDGSRPSTVTAATIGRMKAGVTLFYGWTANYAKYRETYDGFMESVLQNWQQIVDDVVNEAKKRFGGQ